MSGLGEMSHSDVLGGPYYDELTVGQVFAGAPAVTLTDGLAAAHLAITGSRLRLPLDHPLSEVVAGAGPPVAHPGLVIDLAIGQSTVVTQRVIANLFYRGLVLHHAPRLGDTLHTTVSIAGLRDTTPRADRPARGLAVLHVVTLDQDDRVVLDFHRCAMLPMRGRSRPGHDDDLDAIGREATLASLGRSVERWDLAAFAAAVPAAAPAPRTGDRLRLETGDTVTSAPELARLTLNLAGAHHDPFAREEGRRLVYGGHTIGLAAGQLTRALPRVAYIAGWRACDHLAPVYEGDVLRSELLVEAVDPLPAGALLTLRVRAAAHRPDSAPVDVLDWRPVVVTA